MICIKHYSKSSSDRTFFVENTNYCFMFCYLAALSLLSRGTNDPIYHCLKRKSENMDHQCAEGKLSLRLNFH